MTAKQIDEKLRLRGEPKKDKVMIYLPPDLNKELSRVAQDKGFSKTEIIEELVRGYLGKDDPKRGK